LKAECPLVSDRPKPIDTGDESVDNAHNYAIKTYNFYYQQYGRDSLDNNGTLLLSFANVPTLEYNPCPNAQFAFIRDQNFGFMLYCPEDSKYHAFSEAADIVAHEVRHG
jgi:bacillolysin